MVGLAVMIAFVFMGSQMPDLYAFFGSEREKFVTQGVEQRSDILAEKAAYEVKKLKDSKA